MKIAVIGYSGSGKSTLANALGEYYGAEVLHLDCVHWLAGWRERPRAEETEIVARFLDEKESWVIDGNYWSLSFERRLEEADLVVVMQFNRVSCLLRALRRYRRYRGKSRDSMTEGCDEKIDFEFVRWLLWDGRKKRHRARYREAPEKYPEKTVVVKNQRQIDALKKKMKK